MKNYDDALKPEDMVDFSLCRGTKNACRFSLLKDPGVVQDIKQTILNSPLLLHLLDRVNTKPKPHQRLRIGIAACPNACSLPQIKAIGIIARCKPNRIAEGCFGCGSCVKRCTEGSLQMTSGKATLEAQSCIGCGLCLDVCESHLIHTQGMTLDIWVGGVMGRHACLAKSLGEVRPEQVSMTLERILEVLTQRVQKGISIPKALHEIEILEWRDKVLPESSLF